MPNKKNITKTENTMQLQVHGQKQNKIHKRHSRCHKNKKILQSLPDCAFSSQNFNLTCPLSQLKFEGKTLC